MVCIWNSNEFRMSRLILAKLNSRNCSNNNIMVSSRRSGNGTTATIHMPFASCCCLSNVIHMFFFSFSLRFPLLLLIVFLSFFLVCARLIIIWTCCDAFLLNDAAVFPCVCLYIFHKSTQWIVCIWMNEWYFCSFWFIIYLFFRLLSEPVFVSRFFFLFLIFFRYVSVSCRFFPSSSLLPQKLIVQTISTILIMKFFLFFLEKTSS